MDLIYSFLVGLLGILLLLGLAYLPTVTRVVGLWCRDWKSLRSIPCPPRHWLWGHTLQVCSVASYHVCSSGVFNDLKVHRYMQGPF